MTWLVHGVFQSVTKADYLEEIVQLVNGVMQYNPIPTFSLRIHLASNRIAM